jgi:hypothetical protein
MVSVVELPQLSVTITVYVVVVEGIALIDDVVPRFASKVDDH